MFFRTRTILLGCAVLAALSIPASSRPSPNGVEPSTRQQKVQKPAAAKPVAAKPGAAKKNAKSATKPGVKRKLVLRSGLQARRVETTDPAKPPSQPVFGWPSLVSEARKYIGTNPTDMKRRWCARFMNFVLARVGYAGTGSDAARSFAAYGDRISQPEVGAIAVLTRGKNRNFGHVGVISGLDTRGNPIIISGNHGRTVAESVYPRARVIAYVMPKDGSGAVRPMQRILQPLQQRVAQPTQQQTPLPPARPLPPHRIIQQGPAQPRPAQPPQPARVSRASDKPDFAVAVESTMAKVFGDAALTR